MKIKNFNQWINEQDATFKESLNEYHIDIECSLDFERTSQYNFYSANHGNINKKIQERNSLGGQIQNIIVNLMNNEYASKFGLVNEFSESTLINDNYGNNYSHEHVYPSLMEVVCSFGYLKSIDNYDADLENEFKTTIENSIKEIVNNDVIVGVTIHLVKNGTL